MPVMLQNILSDVKGEVERDASTSRDTQLPGGKLRGRFHVGLGWVTLPWAIEATELAENLERINPLHGTATLRQSIDNKLL